MEHSRILDEVWRGRLLTGLGSEIRVIGRGRDEERGDRDQARPSLDTTQDKDRDRSDRRVGTGIRVAIRVGGIARTS
jgi:hypothetical protein